MSANLFVEQLSLIWPTYGFLDTGELVVDSHAPEVVLRDCYDSHADIEYQMAYASASFVFLDKRNKIKGRVFVYEQELELHAEKMTATQFNYEFASSSFMNNLWEYENVRCPEENCDEIREENPMHFIIHLNDSHMYSFKQLSDWLSTINFKPKVMPVFNTKNYLFGDIFENYRNAYRNHSGRRFKWEGQHSIELA